MIKKGLGNGAVPAEYCRGSFDHHIEDTVEAGAGLCHADIVKMVVSDGPARIDELIATYDELKSRYANGE